MQNELKAFFKLNSILTSSRPLNPVALLGLGMFALGSLAGCAKNESLLPKFPAFNLPGVGAEAETKEIGGSKAVESPSNRMRPGPAAPSLQEKAVVESAPLKLSGDGKSISLEQVPIPAFIETVFGQTLGLNYQVDPQVAARTETITLRTSGLKTASELFDITKDVLKTYGIRVSTKDNLTRVLSDQSLTSEVPQVLLGRTLPDVPGTMRPVFQAVQPNSVPAIDMQNWLNAAFGKRVQITSFPLHNVLMLAGLPEDVRAVLDAMRILDQPRLAGRQSMRIDPVFWSADRLAKKLVELLKAEGYNVSLVPDSGSAIVLIPIESLNSFVVFAADPTVMSHISEWVRELDQPSKADPLKKTFVFPVTNTSVENLEEVLSGVIGETTGSGARSSTGSNSTTQVPSLAQSGLNSSLPGQSSLGTSGASSSQSSAAASPGVKTISGQSGPRIVVDSVQNVIIVLGTAAEYAELLPLLQSLDKAPREALIEVTVAEITLKNNEQFGVEWALSFAGIAGANGGGTLSTLGGLGVYTGSGSTPTTGSSSSTTTGTGANLQILNKAGSVAAVINAFASDNRVNILLTPRLLTRSGTEAQIKVGNEVPIITSQSNSPLTTGGTTSILNQVSYRTTGTVLKIKPTVHAGDRVDLDVSQEVSDAQTNNVSSVSSPLIFSRSVSTKLSLRDGATALIGGLIQENRSNTNTEIPWLGDVPVLGLLFKNQSTAKTRTELLIFITPYIIHSGDDMNKITQQVQKGMEAWPATTGKINY